MPETAILEHFGATGSRQRVALQAARTLPRSGGAFFADEHLDRTAGI
jgi:hypothetical protein